MVYGVSFLVCLLTNKRVPAIVGKTLLKAVMVVFKMGGCPSFPLLLHLLLNFLILGLNAFSTPQFTVSAQGRLGLFGTREVIKND